MFFSSRFGQILETPLYLVPLPVKKLCLLQKSPQITGLIGHNQSADWGYADLNVDSRRSTLRFIERVKVDTVTVGPMAARYQ